MRHGKFVLGLLVGAAAMFVIQSLDSHAKAQNRAAAAEQDGIRGTVANPDVALATEPFLTPAPSGPVIVDDRNAVDCWATGSFYTATPTGELELELGVMHGSLYYAQKGQKVPVFRVSTRLLMSRDSAIRIEHTFREAVERAGAGKQPVTRPSDLP